VSDLRDFAAELASAETIFPSKLRSLICALERADRKHLTRAELWEIARFKGTRYGRHRLVEDNCERDVIAISELAFALEDDVLRVKTLCVLHGVSVPVASAILAWCFPAKFPVIDQRAWRTLRRSNLVTGKDDGVNLGLREWGEYLAVVREISKLNGMTPQGIDAALYWQDKIYGDRRNPNRFRQGQSQGFHDEGGEIYVPAAE
jgi:hypothetical protein